MVDDDDVLRQVRDWIAAGSRVGLATVVGTWGSSPRPVGSLLAARDDLRFVGSISGGCIEGAVIEQIVASVRDRHVRLLDFGVSDEQAWEVGLACGGEMRVLIAPAPPSEAFSAMIDGRPIALAIKLDDGAWSLVREGGRIDGAPLDDVRRAEIVEMIRDNRSGMLENPAGSLFVRVFQRPLRLIIVGAVHIAQFLAPMAAYAGFAVTVIDPRRAFATGERFPGVALSHDWPDDALRSLVPDSRTAVVTLTHDPKLDDPALTTALRSDAYYIGALGSRRTHARRIARLKARGFDDVDLARIRAPVGLPLGGRRAGEIAVSILAEAVASCYGGTADRPKRDAGQSETTPLAKR